MDEVVAAVRAMRGSSAEQLQELLQYLESRAVVVQRAVDEIGRVLQDLRPKHHAAACAFLLAEKARAKLGDDLFFEQVQELIHEGTKLQLSVAAAQVCQCLRFYAESLMERGQSGAGIALLQKAIPLVQSQKGQLTPIHVDLLLLCNSSKSFREALAVAKTPLLVYESTMGLTSADVLRYHVYAAHAFAACKKMDKALRCLEVVLQHPANVVSIIALDAFKRHILISLIHRGEAKTKSILTSTTDHLVQEYSRLANSYMNLATCVKNFDVTGVDHILEQSRKEFEEDNNLGLVKQAKASMVKHRILKLTQTYLTLPLEDLAKLANLEGGPQEAERALLGMIERKEIDATISQRNGMVTFGQQQQQSPSTVGSPSGGGVAKMLALEKRLAESQSCLQHIRVATKNFEARSREEREKNEKEQRRGIGIGSASMMELDPRYAMGGSSGARSGRVRTFNAGSRF